MNSSGTATGVPPSPRPSTNGFWSKSRIEAELREWKTAGLPLVDPAPKRITAASCHLTVGSEIFISPATEDDPKARRVLRKNEACVIPAGQFAFLITAETVRMPTHAIGFIALRSKVAKFRGLVNVSGFHVDPGYRGKLIFSVFNAGPGPIHIIEGEPWFEIFFADLSDASEHQEGQEKVGFSGIPSELITPIAEQFHSFAGLNEKITEKAKALEDRIHALEREQGIVRWAAVLVAGALLAVVLRPLWDGSSRQTHNLANAAIATSALGDTGPANNGPQ